MAPCCAASRSDFAACCAEASHTVLPTSSTLIQHVSIRSLRNIIRRSPSLIRCPRSEALGQRQQGYFIYHDCRGVRACYNGPPLSAHTSTTREHRYRRSRKSCKRARSSRVGGDSSITKERYTHSCIILRHL